MQAKVFVGYTEVGARFGETLASLLSASVDVGTWKGASSARASIVSEILHQPGQYDFGVFVFSPDDFRFSGDRVRQVFLAPNLAFELGFFLGLKGRNRAFPVWPLGHDLPSDLQGVIHPRFDPAAAEPAAALQPACEQILSRTQTLHLAGKSEETVRSVDGAERARHPAQLHLDDCFFIMNKRTGLCIDVEDWARRPVKRIIPWRYQGGLNQLWSVEPHEEPWFKITSVHGGKCLQVKDGSTDDGSPIEEGIFEGHKHQQWSLTQGPERAYVIAARHSGKVLAVQAGGHGKRGVVVQCTSKHGDDKLWWISRAARI